MSRRAALTDATATMVAVLGALATTLLLREVAPVPTQVMVLAVVLALMLRRTTGRGVRLGPAAAAQVVLLSVVAAGVGWLLVHAAVVGETLLVVGLSVGILARRYAGAVRRAGRLVAQPFLALLVTPVPVVAGTTSTHTLLLWPPVGAAVAVAWTAAIARVRPGPAMPATEVAHRPSRRRIDAPTRMALQMLVGLGVAMVLGRLLFGHHWAWCVLSAFIVASGNRGRGDVVHKAALRVVGAAAGTVTATLATLDLPPGHRSTLVALFAVMAVAPVLRDRSYAFWAAGMTGMLSLLHAYYGTGGQGGAEQLGDRLLGVLVGSAVGVAASWWVLPVRTRDVFRARVAECLRALRAGDGTYPDALAELDRITPTLRAAACHHPGSRQRLAAVRALNDVDPADPDPDLRTVHAALRDARPTVRSGSAPRPAADAP